MSTQTGEHWSSLLKSAVLCMNSTIKKSHSYTPFQVMWGRESNYLNLVHVISKIEISHDEDYELEDDIISESLPAEGEGKMDLFSPSEDHFESIDLINESREKTCKIANANIKSEQLKQKRQYDRKVNDGRYVILLFKFCNITKSMVGRIVYYINLGQTLKKGTKSYIPTFPSSKKCRTQKVNLNFSDLLQLQKSRIAMPLFLRKKLIEERQKSTYPHHTTLSRASP